MNYCVTYYKIKVDGDYMGKALILGLFLVFSAPKLTAEEVNCKNLKLCAEWATAKTGVSYALGSLEKRSLKIDKGLDLSEGDPDTMFTYLLEQSDFARVKRENGGYEIIAIRDLKQYHFPLVKLEELKPNLDYYSLELTLKNKEKVKNAMIILKKYLSKNGKILEVTDSSKIMIIDTGVQLYMLKNLAMLIDR